MNTLEQLKRAKEGEPVAVYVLSEWPEDCMACEVNSDCETHITSRGECPLRKAIALVEPNGHLIYLREEVE